MRKLVSGILMMVAGQWAAAENLLDIYELAMKNDAQLAIAKATRDAALEARPLAKSALLPNLSASGSANYLDTEQVAGGSSTGYSKGEAGISLVQSLFGKDRWLRLDQADQQIAAAEADYISAEQDLVLRAAKAYFGVLSAQDNLTFVQSEKKAIERQLDQAKQRFEVGLIAITGVHEAQARYDQSRADEILAQNELDTAMEALREIIGSSPASLAGLTDGLALAPPSPADVGEWTATALATNPTVKAAEYGSEVARKEVEVQRAARLPTVDLVGSYSISRSNDSAQNFLGQPVSPGTDRNTATIGVQLAVPLYTGGRISAATREAQARFQEAQDRLDASRKAVDRQTRDAYRGVQASISRVYALEATAISAQSALDATTAGFDVGTRTLVDVLNGQRDLFRAQRDYAQSKYDYILNRLSLELAAGTLDRADLEEMNAWLK